MREAVVTGPLLKVARHRVLVVDDYPDAAEILCVVIEMLGHECRPAHSGSNGLRIANEFHPDVVILDIGLPDTSGYEVAHTLRRGPNGQHLYLVALTGFNRPDDRARAVAAGFDQYVLKPFGHTMITQIMQRAAERRPSLQLLRREPGEHDHGPAEHPERAAAVPFLRLMGP
jgi:CheY-like chemotaxis protein